MWEKLQHALSASSALGAGDILARLMLAFLLTTTVAWVYSRNYKGYGRPSQMGLVLVLVSLATCGIIMAIGDNLALSLGMVGALSIVRFRAAVKDNRDLAYLFWTLALGLVCGAGAYKLALLLFAVLGAVAVTLERLQLVSGSTRRYVVILSLSREGAAEGAPPPGLPADAQLKSSVFHKEGGLEERTYLVDFGSPADVERFQAEARAADHVRGYQVLSPEDAVLG